MRLEDWDARLLGVVRAYWRAPYAWGQHDCCLFAARCIDAVTGSTWAAELQALYQDRTGACRLLMAEGGLAAAVSRRLGFPVPGPAARDADVCRVAARSVGVRFQGAILVLGRRGLHPRSPDLALEHWRVG